MIASVLFSCSLNLCTKFLKKNKANGEARKKQTSPIPTNKVPPSLCFATYLSCSAHLKQNI